MLPAATARILASLPDGARVLDVGGWAAPFNRATHVLDMEPYETRGILGSYGPPPERFSRDSWVIHDMCAPEPWPFADDFFDFSLCVTTLEDVRDPIRVCAELSRVSKAGYVEVPTIEAELMQYAPGQGPWLGHLHHRWLCDRDGETGGLVFWHKDHSLHFDWRLRIVPRWHERLSVEDQLLGVFWEGALPAREAFVGFDTHAAWVDSLAARVRAKVRPSRADLAARAARERARGATGRALAPLRRAVERRLARP